jgi:hypothetical protein
LARPRWRNAHARHGCGGPRRESRDKTGMREEQRLKQSLQKQSFQEQGFTVIRLQKAPPIETRGVQARPLSLLGQASGICVEYFTRSTTRRQRARKSGWKAVRTKSGSRRPSKSGQLEDRRAVAAGRVQSRGFRRPSLLERHRPAHGPGPRRLSGLGGLPESIFAAMGCGRPGGGGGGGGGVSGRQGPSVPASSANKGCEASCRASLPH